MSTSRFGDAEWGEQFEREDDPLVTIGQADGDGFGDTSYLDEEPVVASAEQERGPAPADALEVLAVLEVQRENSSFCESDCAERITEDSLA